MSNGSEMTSMTSRLHEYLSTIAPFATLICGALVFLWISRGTQLHQLAIGIVMSSVTLALALTLFELCWRVALWAAGFFGLDRRN